MAGHARTAALPLLGRLSYGESAHRTTELEAEVVALFDCMRARILRYVLSFGLPIADAEEIVQDVFLALYQHLAGGRSRDAIHGWLFRVAHNLSLKRRAGLSANLDDDQVLAVADPSPNPEAQFAFRQRQQRLRSVVDALPQIDRECLYLRAEGFRYREIAEVMGISLGSVANSLAKSLSRLTAADERLG